MDYDTGYLADDLHRYYSQCMESYGIDCHVEYASACASKHAVWTGCSSPPFNETELIERIDSIKAGNSSLTNPCGAAPRYCLMEVHLFDFVKAVHWRMFYFYAPIASLMCLIALITNAIGLAGLVRTRPKYPRHYLLISMSVSDTMLSILTLLKKTGDVISSSNEMHRFFIRYLNALWQTTFLASALMLLALAVEAFIALTATFIYETFARRRYIILLFIGIVWVLSFTFSLVLLLTGTSYEMTFQYAVSILLVLIIGVTISCYLYAFVLAERARKDIRNQRRASAMIDRNSVDHGRSKSGRRKSLLTVCLLMTSSIVSWLPLTVYMMLGQQVEQNFPFYNRLLHTFLIMFHLNAIINPLTYALRMNAVRATLRRFLRLKKSQNQSSLLLTTTSPVGSHNYSHSAVKKLSSGSAANGGTKPSLSHTCSTPLMATSNDLFGDGVLIASNKASDGVPRKSVTIMESSPLPLFKLSEGDDDHNELSTNVPEENTSNNDNIKSSPRPRYESAPGYLASKEDEEPFGDSRVVSNDDVIECDEDDENEGGNNSEKAKLLSLVITPESPLIGDDESAPSVVVQSPKTLNHAS